MGAETQGRGGALGRETMRELQGKGERAEAMREVSCGSVLLDRVPAWVDFHVLWRVCFTHVWRMAGAHWKEHKPNCNPFCAQTTVTLKPSYGGPMMSETISRADFTRQALGLATPATRPLRPGFTKNEAENKSMVIKIQVPVGLDNSPISSALGELFVYNKKRDFVCTVARASNSAAYDAIVQIVRSRGVGGAKAYFAAELKNPDQLVVKISEVLAEQPF